MFRSPILYHAIAEWKPTLMKPFHEFTPGRIALVFFTRKELVDEYENKPINYGKKTVWGKGGTCMLTEEEAKFCI